MEAKSAVQFYRITEIGARLALSRSSIYREIEAGNLHAVRIGKALRITSDELARYASSLEHASNRELGESLLNAGELMKKDKEIAEEAKQLLNSSFKRGQKVA